MLNEFGNLQGGQWDRVEQDITQENPALSPVSKMKVSVYRNLETWTETFISF